MWSGGLPEELALRLLEVARARDLVGMGLGPPAQQVGPANDLTAVSPAHLRPRRSARLLRHCRAHAFEPPSVGGTLPGHLPYSRSGLPSPASLHGGRWVARDQSCGCWAPSPSEVASVRRPATGWPNWSACRRAPFRGPRSGPTSRAASPSGCSWPSYSSASPRAATSGP